MASVLFKYIIDAYLLIPKRGVYLFEIWLPKNDFIRKKTISLLKSNISADILKNTLIVLVALALMYLLYHFLDTATTSFLLNKKFIRYDHGIIERGQDSVDMVLVIDQSLSQSVYERILGLATITIFSKDLTHPELIIKGVGTSKAKSAVEFLRLYSISSIVDYKMTEDEIIARNSLRKNKNHIAEE